MGLGRAERHLEKVRAVVHELLLFCPYNAPLDYLSPAKLAFRHSYDLFNDYYLVRHDPSQIVHVSGAR